MITGCEILNRRPAASLKLGLELETLIAGFCSKLIDKANPKKSDFLEGNVISAEVRILVSLTAMLRLTSLSKRQQLSLVFVVYPDRSTPLTLPNGPFHQNQVEKSTANIAHCAHFTPS